MVRTAGWCCTHGEDCQKCFTAVVYNRLIGLAAVRKTPRTLIVGRGPCTLFSQNRGVWVVARPSKAVLSLARPWKAVPQIAQLPPDSRGHDRMTPAPIIHPSEMASNAERASAFSFEPRSLRTFTPTQAVLARSAGIYHWT